MAAARLRTVAAYGLRGAGIVWGLHREAQIRRVPRELRSVNLRRPLPMWRASLAPLVRHLTDVPTEVVAGVEVGEVVVGSVRVLVHEPVGRERPSGAVVWMHGGGLMLGRAENAHERCSTLARDLGVLAVSVDYRVAPEAPFPAALDDCMVALQWVHDQSAELGVYPARIAVGGDSAGGGLAACVAQRAHDEGITVALQVLFYPMLDDRTGLRGDRQGIRGPLTWTPMSNRSGWSAYLGHPAGQNEDRAYAVAARREDLSGLAPTWIGVGEYDLFHDEDVEYARRLTESAVACELVTVPGMYHGADSVQPSPPSMVAFLGSASTALARAIGSPTAPRLTAMSRDQTHLTIAIDGPSGSGKSSVSKAVADRLGVGYLDTGAMYRALTWWCLDQGVELNDEAAVVVAAQALPLELSSDPEGQRVVVGGTDVTTDIRTTAISSEVSKVATNTGVRPILQQAQRDRMAAIADETGGVVAEGRDITTVVAPDALVRILLTASEDARLRRRSAEVHGTADEEAIAATRDQVLRRDRDDSAVSQFTVAADGVVTVDTSDLDFDESVEAVLAVVASVAGHAQPDSR